MDVKDARVKGTVLLDYVRLIHVAKDKNWDKYLKKEDWNIINGRILPSVWYPYEYFYRFGNAVLQEIAGGNMDIVRQFGKSNAETLFKGTYKGIMESTITGGGGAIRFLERYTALVPTLFNFAVIVLEKVSEKHVKFNVKVDLKLEEVLWEPYFAQLSGTVEKVVEMCGGKNPRVKIIAKRWEGGAQDSVLDIVWD